MTIITGSKNKNKLNNSTKNSMAKIRTIKRIIQALIPVTKNILVEIP